MYKISNLRCTITVGIGQNGTVDIFLDWYDSEATGFPTCFTVFPEYLIDNSIVQGVEKKLQRLGLI